jgi:ABC-type branched-subunit amino acid transport system ATPase component
MSGWAAFRQWMSRGKVAERVERHRPEVRGMLQRVSLEIPSVLEVHGIAKNLSGVQALRSVDLVLAPGTIHALIGPNGSGKTTLLNVMSGYLEPDTGEVLLLGQDVKGWPTHRRAQLGLSRTFQTPYTFQDATCRDNVLIALDLHGRHDAISQVLRLPPAFRQERRQYKRALELLEAVGLGSEITTPAGQLPPGELRLLELARVLALEPKVVLMDEPVAGLTSHEIDEFEGAIRALREAGIAVLLVEHHVDFVLRLADTVTVMDFGKVIAHGDPEQVRTNPAVLSAYLGQPEESLSDDIELPAGATAVEDELEARFKDAEAPAEEPETSPSP